MAETLTQLRARRLALNAEVIELAGQDELTDEQQAEFTVKTESGGRLGAGRLVAWLWRCAARDAKRPQRRSTGAIDGEDGQVSSARQRWPPNRVGCAGSRRPCSTSRAASSSTAAAWLKWWR